MWKESWRILNSLQNYCFTFWPLLLIWSHRWLLCSLPYSVYWSGFSEETGQCIIMRHWLMQIWRSRSPMICCPEKLVMWFSLSLRPDNQGSWWYKSKSKSRRRWNEISQCKEWGEGERGRRHKFILFHLLFSNLQQSGAVQSHWGAQSASLSVPTQMHLDTSSQTHPQTQFSLAPEAHSQWYRNSSSSSASFQRSNFSFPTCQSHSCLGALATTLPSALTLYSYSSPTKFAEAPFSQWDLLSVS